MSKKKKCKVCRKFKVLEVGFYNYRYMRGGKLVRRRMDVCKLCMKIRRVHKNLSGDVKRVNR